MDNRNYQYLDHDFDPAKASAYTLLVQVTGNSLSFAVTAENRLLLLADGLHTNELSHESSEDNLLLKSYGKRIIGLAVSGFTFVPLAVFNPEKVADFARFLNVKATEKVFSQPLDAGNQVIFKVNEDLVHAFGKTFDVKDIVFGAKGWIKAIAGEYPANENLYLNILNDQVEILNFKDGKLRFYNRFAFQNEDELAYFVTVVAGELQITPTLILSGDVTSDDKYNSRLSRFFGNVQQNNIKVIGLPKQFSPHSSLSLTALSLCGS